MGKKPELSKELKRSSDKAQKRYVKAYAKALDKHGDEKKARKKAQKKLEKKYELVGKKYEKIAEKVKAEKKSDKKDSKKVETKKPQKAKKAEPKKKAKKGTKSAAQREAELILAETAESLELVDSADFDEDLTTEPLAEAPAQENTASAPDLQDDDNQTFLVAEVRPLAELTRAELYELAKQLEVPGRSSMNKGDLLIAVRAAQ